MKRYDGDEEKDSLPLSLRIVKILVVYTNLTWVPIPGDLSGHFVETSVPGTLWDLSSPVFDVRRSLV